MKSLKRIDRILNEVSRTRDFSVQCAKCGSQMSGMFSTSSALCKACREKLPSYKKGSSKAEQIRCKQCGELRFKEEIQKRTGICHKCDDERIEKEARKAAKYIKKHDNKTDNYENIWRSDKYIESMLSSMKSMIQDLLDPETSFRVKSTSFRVKSTSLKIKNLTFSRKNKLKKQAGKYVEEMGLFGLVGEMLKNFIKVKEGRLPERMERVITIIFEGLSKKTGK